METLMVCGTVLMLVFAIAGLIALLCWFCYASFGEGGSIWNYLLFGREGIEACLKGIGWCFYGIAVVVGELLNSNN